MEGLDAVERSGVAIKMNVYVDHAVQCPPRSSDDVVKATELLISQTRKDVQKNSVML